MQTEQIDYLLRGTARSFYLTLHVLPTSIRSPLSLAYLLARATDTIADEHILTPDQRLTLLAEMRTLITKGSIENSIFYNWLAQLQNDSITNELLINFPHLIAQLHQLDNVTQQAIKEVLKQIIKGQSHDIKKFSGSEKIVCFDTINELDCYTYHVAGSVGQFWNRICELHLQKYSNLSFRELNYLAVSLGKGLQLINILRDFPHDLKQGRCYIPLEQLQQYHLLLNDIRENPSCIFPIMHYWQSKAIMHLENGWRYLVSINSRLIRYALTLPVLIGFATLNQLKNKSYLNSPTLIKISRNEVKWLMLIAATGMISKASLNYVSRKHRTI